MGLACEAFLLEQRTQTCLLSCMCFTGVDHPMLTISTPLYSQAQVEALGARLLFFFGLVSMSARSKDRDLYH
jgi:hypothetical protein